MVKFKPNAFYAYTKAGTATAMNLITVNTKIHKLCGTGFRAAMRFVYRFLQRLPNESKPNESKPNTICIT